MTIVQFCTRISSSDIWSDLKVLPLQMSDESHLYPILNVKNLELSRQNVCEIRVVLKYQSFEPKFAIFE